MRTALLGTAAWTLLTAAAASAQPFANPGFGGQGFGGGFGNNWNGGYGNGFGGGFGNGFGGGNFMQNIYNPRNQPLSPYLNLLRGGNAGVNYYYGVRPGTTGSGFGGGAPGMAPGGFRPLGYPFQFSQDETPTLPEPGEGYALPPAGHPAVFNNTLGYFPGGVGGARGGPRPGFGGATAPRPGGAGGTPGTPRR